MEEELVWLLAKEIPNKDPDQIRADAYGNEIHCDQYGKKSPYGWEVVHIKPKALGGSDHIRNLQAVQTNSRRCRRPQQNPSFWQRLIGKKAS
ncbi:MAG: HNH endonuclease signature motif containing protein [Gammaproteobacteria bacterium]